MRDNGTFVVTGLGAAVMKAELYAPRIRPGGKVVDLHPVINWEDASEEMRNDQKVLWITHQATLMHPKRTYTFRSHTEEEKEELRLNEIYKLEQMFNFILKHYGWRYAKEFYEWDDWRKKFDKYGIVPNLNIPHCKYEKNHQCDLECPFFKGYCTYKEEE